MTLLYHVYAIRNILSRGVSSDDSPFSLRFIAHMLSVARGRLIEQKADKYHYISEQSFQSLCLDLSLGQFHNCCNGPELPCQLLKSEVVLPKFLNTRWGDFVKVMTLDGTVIPKASLTQGRLSKYSLTQTAETPSYFIHDNYLYIQGNKHLQKVLLNSLFSDPEAIHQANCATGSNSCPDFLDTEYPIDPDLVDPMYRLTIELLLNALKLQADTENNARAE